MTVKMHIFIFYFYFTGKTSSYFYYFSFIKSINELLNYNEKSKFNVIDGFKFIIMLFILFGHRFLYMISFLSSNAKHFENVSKNFNKLFNLNKSFIQFNVF